MCFFFTGVGVGVAVDDGGGLAGMVAGRDMLEGAGDDEAVDEEGV